MSVEDVEVIILYRRKQSTTDRLRALSMAAARVPTAATTEYKEGGTPSLVSPMARSSLAGPAPGYIYLLQASACHLHEALLRRS
jgi:hypothetical protein